MEMSPNECNALLRSDLSSFIALVFTILNPHAEFLPCWYFDLIASKLMAVMRGEITRLIINIPPRYGKSITVSVAFVAFLLGHQPSSKVLAVTYGQNLSEKNARDLKTVMNSEKYKNLFSTRLSAEKQTAEEFLTSGGGSYFATSISGVMTGRGGDYIIIDDPLKPDEAVSEGQRQKVNDCFDTTIYSRLDNKKTGRIIDVMQRVHEDDLVGHVLRQESWEVISLPAIAENDEEYEINTPLGSYVQHRKAGEPLHPARESLETLARLRLVLGEYNFSGQYQQRPAPMGGGLIKSSWFKFYTPDSLPDSFDSITQSWDTASKASELSDYSVCTTWGIKGKNIYLLHVHREKLLYPDLRRVVKELAARYSPNFVLIEDKGSGIHLLDELRRDGLPGLRSYQPVHDKRVRLSAQTGFFEAGLVYFPPKETPFMVPYIPELLIFPNSSHDDQVDSTAQALEFFKHDQQKPGLVAYYERQAEEIRNPKIKMVRVQAPPNISHYEPRGKPRILLDASRIVEVPEDDVRGLVLGGWKRLD